jgi:putative flavoprotein involved in K+ transport
LMELALGDLYSERALKNGITTDKADLIFASLPYKIMHTFQIPIYEEMARQDADFYKRLEKAGFLLDFGDDGSGLFMKYLRRGSGYYIDVGASELIANGKIKLKSGVDIKRIKPNSLEFSDGTELPADLIIYATGYGSMNGWAAKLISQEVADKVGKCWGLGSDTQKDPGPWEGEQRNMWWKLAPVTALFAVFVVATESKDGRDFDTCVWTWEGASFELDLLCLEKKMFCWLEAIYK